jgi:Zn-dependent protease
MFGPVQPTRYDLAFPLFGIPVRVIPWFWLAGVLLGLGLLQDQERGMVLLLIWLGVMFVSILAHEMGHACLAAIFGYPPSILLYQFGGLTLYQPTRNYTTARAVLITAAGPAFGFALAAASMIGMVMAGLTLGFGQGGTTLWEEALGMSVYINIFWTVLNLMPVIPLDGGQICREVCMAASPRRGIFVALWISIVVAALLGLFLFFLRQPFGGIMFLMLAAQNYQELQQHRAW